MPWRQVTPMEERAAMIAAVRHGCCGVAEASRQWGVSRKTIYKWLARFDAEGPEGLADRSRAPHTCPHRTPPEIVLALEAARRAHPTWGPRKLLYRLSRERQSAQGLPAPSTASDILKRAGLVPHRRRRQQPPRAAGPAVLAERPNDVWCVDFKGEFLVGPNHWCYPLTVTDQSSRYLLVCQGLTSPAHEPTRTVLEALFHQVGLPYAIRTDNGTPFGSASVFGLSRLTVWFMKLGIVHDPIQPGKPQQNGAHERMHRTLKNATARPPATNLVAQQDRFDRFRREYNQDRPHEGIGMRTPAHLWVPSQRVMPTVLPDPQYDPHMQIRRVKHTGEIKFLGTRWFLSEVLSGEQVALDEVEDGIWRILLYNTQLGWLDQKSQRILPAGRPNRPKASPMYPD